MSKCVICNSLEICEETLKCLKHCESKTHFHCERHHCNSSNLCEMSEKSECTRCCYELNHSHCVWLCDSISHCEMSKKSKCAEHCHELNHFHCRYYCDSLNLCKMSEDSECIECCRALNHSHKNILN